MAKTRIAPGHKRVSVYFSAERLEKFDHIVAYFKREELLVEMKNFSQTLGLMIDTFHTLFIETGDPSLKFEERLAQLSMRNQTLIGEVKKENRQLKKQLDQLLYLSLANFHLNANEDWNVEELESISSDYDAEQKQLLERVTQLIKEDTERGQVIKHSHKF